MWILGWALLGMAGARGDQENPEFTWWSTFAPGSWVQIRMDGELEGRPFALEQVHTLLQADADRVVVSRKGTMTWGGQILPGSKERDEVLRADPKSIKIEQTGTEAVVIGDRKLDTRWIEGVDPRTESRVKFWISAEIPGGVAKGELRPAGTGSVVRLTAVGWERKP